MCLIAFSNFKREKVKVNQIVGSFMITISLQTSTSLRQSCSNATFSDRLSQWPSSCDESRFPTADSDCSCCSSPGFDDWSGFWCGTSMMPFYPACETWRHSSTASLSGPAGTYTSFINWSNDRIFVLNGLHGIFCTEMIALNCFLSVLTNLASTVSPLLTAPQQVQNWRHLLQTV